MRIWLINPYGPIPGEGWRDYRFTLLGEALAERGHDVIWWTGNFSHHFKWFRSESWKDIVVASGFTIRLVPTTSYEKNISLGRIRFEATFAWNLYKRTVKLEAPDCIVGTDPSQIVGFLSTRLAKKFCVPLFLDVFDLWPELFILAFPRVLRPFAPMILWPLYWLRKSNLQNATAITALCETYLRVAREQALNVDAARFLTVFNGIDVAGFRAAANDEAPTIIDWLGYKRASEVWAVYAGSLGNNYDIQTLLRAACELEQRNSPLRIWIAGDGPFRSQVKEFIETHHLENLTYLGKLEPRKLVNLYRVCDIGICPYAPDSNVGMADKAYDYMAAGLPIINSLRGELENLLRDRRIGLQYKAGEPGSLAHALECLATDESHRKELARNSYDAAMQFDKRVQYPRFVDFIEKVLQLRITARQ